MFAYDFIKFANKLYMLDFPHQYDSFIRLVET